MDNQKNYRITKHQSELAVRVTGNSQADLFANSALALFDVMATRRAKDRVKESIPFEVEGTDRDDLIVNWVRELLYLYQGSGYLLKEFQNHRGQRYPRQSRSCGEKIDPDRHEIKQEIAAVADLQESHAENRQSMDRSFNF